jgi:hypothetical protein
VYHLQAYCKNKTKILVPLVQPHVPNAPLHVAVHHLHIKAEDVRNNSFKGAESAGLERGDLRSNLKTDKMR